MLHLPGEAGETGRWCARGLPACRPGIPPQPARAGPHLHCAAGFRASRRLARVLDSLVRVSRRVGWVADVAADPGRPGVARARPGGAARSGRTERSPPRSDSGAGGRRARPPNGPPPRERRRPEQKGEGSPRRPPRPRPRRAGGARHTRGAAPSRAPDTRPPAPAPRDGPGAGNGERASGGVRRRRGRARGAAGPTPVRPRGPSGGRPLRGRARRRSSPSAPGFGDDPGPAAITPGGRSRGAGPPARRQPFPAVPEPVAAHRRGGNAPDGGRTPAGRRSPARPPPWARPAPAKGRDGGEAEAGIRRRPRRPTLARRVESSGPTARTPPVYLLTVSRPLELSLQSSFQLSLTVLVGYRSRAGI